MHGVLRSFGSRARLALLLVGALAPPPARAGEEALRVFASSAIAPAVEELARAWEAQRPALRVAVVAGPSGVLRRHVEHGARADLFVAPASELARLDQAGLLRFAGRETLAADEVVLALRPGAVPPERFEALAATGLARIGIPNPTTVAEGLWAVQALDAFALRERLAARLVRTASTTEALARLAAGELDAALVPRAEALGWSGRVFVGPQAPARAHETSRYDAAVPETAADVGGALLFVDFMRSDEGRAVLERRGYRPLD